MEGQQEKEEAVWGWGRGVQGKNELGRFLFLLGSLHFFW